GRAGCRVRLGQVDEALADVSRALRLGRPSSRLYYNAARVHARAAARPRDGGAWRAEHHEEEAVRLLRRALALEPDHGRPAFWRDGPRAASAFAPTRRGSLMTRLGAEILVRP